MDPDIKQLVIWNDKNELTPRSLQKLKNKLHELKTIIQEWSRQLEKYQVVPEKVKFFQVQSQFFEVEGLLDQSNHADSGEIQTLVDMLKKISQKFDDSSKLPNLRSVNNSLIAFGSGSISCGDIIISTDPQTSSSAKNSKGPKQINSE